MKILSFVIYGFVLSCFVLSAINSCEISVEELNTIGVFCESDDEQVNIELEENNQPEVSQINNDSNKTEDVLN